MIEAADCKPSSSIAISRILNFCTFPVTVMGKSVVTLKYRGTLKCATLLPAEGAQLVVGHLGAVAQHDPGHELFAHAGVGHADHLHARNGGMLEQQLLDLAG